MTITNSKRITILQHPFAGPYTNTASLKDRAGIYAICDHRLDGKWYILDVGESTRVKTRVENHDRAACWRRNRRGTLGVAVLYTPGWSADQRRALESRIRDYFDPVCGKR